MKADPAEPSSMRESLYQELRRRIIVGELRPGQPLRDAELMAELSVGRTPIREALMLLASEGLVTAYHRQGTYVSNVTVESLQSALEMPLNLELFAIHLCIKRANDTELGALQDLVSGSQNLSNEKAVLAFDQQVHGAIVSLARNQYLADAWARAYAVCSRIKHLSLSPVQGADVVRLELGAVAAAIRRRDAAAAATAMVAHLRSFELTIDAGGSDFFSGEWLNVTR